MFASPRAIPPLVAVAGLWLALAGATNAEVVAFAENGQALIFRKDQLCFGVVPQHVFGERRRQRYEVRGAGQRIGTATRRFEFGYDLSLVTVSGGIVDECRTDLDAVVKRVPEVLDRAGRGEIVAVDEAGAVARQPVAIDRFDFDYVFVRPAAREGRIMQSQSGSSLVADGVTLGLLTAVCDEGPGTACPAGASKVLRLDRIRAIVGPALSGVGATSESGGPASAPAAALPAILLEPIWTSSRAVDGAHGVSNLVTPGAGTPWVAHVDALPIELDFGVVGPDAQAVREAIVEPADVPGATIPREVVIQVSASRVAPRWREFGRLTLLRGETARLSYPTGTYIRAVKLVLGTMEGNEPRVALRRFGMR